MVVRDRYADFRKAALSGGASLEETEEAIQIMREEDAKIDARVCPKCGAQITRAVDARQGGPTKVPGKWFNYRCTHRCGWMTDRCEPIGEN